MLPCLNKCVSSGINVLKEVEQISIDESSQVLTRVNLYLSVSLTLYFLTQDTDIDHVLLHSAVCLSVSVRACHEVSVLVGRLRKSISSNIIMIIDF